MRPRSRERGALNSNIRRLKVRAPRFKCRLWQTQTTAIGGRFRNNPHATFLCAGSMGSTVLLDELLIHQPRFSATWLPLRLVSATWRSIRADAFVRNKSVPLRLRNPLARVISSLSGAGDGPTLLPARFYRQPLSSGGNRFATHSTQIFSGYVPTDTQRQTWNFNIRKAKIIKITLLKQQNCTSTLPIQKNLRLTHR